MWASVWLNQGLGGLLLVGGLVISFLALGNYNLAEFSGTQQLKAHIVEDHLKTNGLNAHVRHPLYLGILLLVWGYFLYQTHAAALILALVTSAYVFIGSVLEERKLVQVFGESYRTYQAETPMLFPSPF